MAGYEKPRLRLSSLRRPSEHLAIILRCFVTLCMSLFMGLPLFYYYAAADLGSVSYLYVYLVGFFAIWLTVLAQYFMPAPVKISQVLSTSRVVFHRSHISHMRVDRVRRLPGYQKPSHSSSWLCRFLWLAWLWGLILHIQLVLGRGPPTAPNCSSQTFALPHSLIIELPECCFSDESECKGHFSEPHGIEEPPSDTEWGRSDKSPLQSCGLAFRLRGGCGSDDCSSESEAHSTSVTHGLAFRFRGGQTSEDYSSDDGDNAPKRKRKSGAASKPRKRPDKGKGKTKATDSDSDSEFGIRVTAMSERRSKGGIFVQIIHIYAARESWDVPPSTNRIAYILDLTDTPELLTAGRKTLRVDGLIKKECQDSFTGPTGSTAEKHLAKVVIFGDDEPVLCRRSNLTCSGCYKCSLAADDFLENCQRCDDTDETHLLVSEPIMQAKASEATSVAAIASAFYRGITNSYCKGKFLDSDVPCGGCAILRKFSQSKKNGKIYFIGCSNWTAGDSDQMSMTHRFTQIPFNVRESILVKLFKGEPIGTEDDDTEVLAGSCKQIIHPSHLTKNSVCPRNHFLDGRHIIAQLQKHECRAQLSILVPIDETDLRAVIIPAAGAPHSHPSFTRTKVPAAVQQTWFKCIDAAGPIGITTLRVDKASSTRQILDGKLVQETHPSMINNRKRRDMLKDHRKTSFPEGTGLPAIYSEFDKDQSRDIADRYIHAITTRPDGTHVIITVNPELAKLALEAIWIMVDTTFAVVHGKTNEWKLVVWLNSIDKRTVIGRVWSNRASREAFVLVWNGIFDAIETITGKKLNFNVFSSKSRLLGAIGDSEGAQAQGLGDVIILRRMNLLTVGNLPTVDVNSILMLIWKTCIVHFNRGVFALKAYIDEMDLAYLLGFPYLCSDEEIQEYYTFCADCTNTKVQSWWAHKLSYPWLLPSLNRELSRMENRHWDLTPRDTNPIEGSHAQDNQVNSTHRTLLDAILLAKSLDRDTAQVIRATIVSGGLENPNNSLEARFKSQAQRQARRKEKQLEQDSLTGQEAKKLHNEVKTRQQKSKEDQLEIARLRRKIESLSQPTYSRLSNPPPSFNTLAGPSNRHSSATPDYIDVDKYSPQPMKALNLFSGLRPMTPIAEPRSDFDYAGALNSDIMDRTLRGIEEDHPMYPVDSDEEVLASDPYPMD